MVDASRYGKKILAKGQEDPSKREYAIYSWPGGSVRDSASHPDPQKAYALAWAKFITLQREAWDDHDQQLLLLNI